MSNVPPRFVAAPLLPSVLEQLDEIECEHPGGPTVCVTGGSSAAGEGHASSNACPACVDDVIAVISERYPNTAVTSLHGRLSGGRTLVESNSEMPAPLAGAAALAASPAEAERARRWLTDLTAGALEVDLDGFEVVTVVNLLHPGGWRGFLADATAGARPWLDEGEAAAQTLTASTPDLTNQNGDPS